MVFFIWDLSWDGAVTPDFREILDARFELVVASGNAKTVNRR
jgi:hypothetical protein